MGLVGIGVLCVGWYSLLVVNVVVWFYGFSVGWFVVGVLIYGCCIGVLWWWFGVDWLLFGYGLGLVGFVYWGYLVY